MLRKEHGRPPYLTGLQRDDGITRDVVIGDETIDIRDANTRLVGHHKDAGLVVSMLGQPGTNRACNTFAPLGVVDNGAAPNVD